MSTHSIDAILLAGGASLRYFTNVRWYNSERLFAAILPARGQPFCVCPSFESDRAHEQWNASPFPAMDILA